MRETAWNQDYDNTKWMTTHLKKTSPVQNLTESLCPVPLDDPLPSWQLTEACHVLRNNQIISHWSAPRIWWRHLTTTTRMLWGKLVCSVFLSFCFCEESARAWHMYITKIAAKCILVVVVKICHRTDVLTWAGTRSHGSEVFTVHVLFGGSCIN